MAKDSRGMTAARRGLLTWFRREARDLPWRRADDDPYRVWVSEIMLQQTRVETVVGYYERFLAAFPDVAALAQARRDDVLKRWEGLGYYRRAHNLHDAAKEIVERRGGEFPQDAAGWAALPGVGRYTAAAIASITRGEAVAVLDGNVKRVLARLFDVEECIDDGPTVRRLWDLAEALLDRSAPGDFNQAMMELGARICTPRKPKCDECPVAAQCEAKRLRLRDELPVRRRKKPVPHYEIVAAAIRRDGHFLLGRRPDHKMLGGLWEFPGGKVEPGETHAEALARELREELGIEARVGRRIASVDHAYSHFSISLHVYDCEHVGGEPVAHWHSELRWIAREDFDKHAFPAADLKFMDRL